MRITSYRLLRLFGFNAFRGVDCYVDMPMGLWWYVFKLQVKKWLHR